MVARISREPSALASPGLLDGVADRDRGNRRAVTLGAVDRAADHVPGHERPRRIVDHDDVGLLRRLRKRVGDRILPARAAATNDSCRGTVVAQELRHGDRDASAGSATTISSMRSLAASAATLISRIERPPISRNCFGRSAPRRTPRPPAAIMAATYMSELMDCTDKRPARSAKASAGKRRMRTLQDSSISPAAWPSSPAARAALARRWPRASPKPARR